MDMLESLRNRVEALEKQGAADWNACCDVLVWSRSTRDDLPPSNRALEAVLDRLKAAETRMAELEREVAELHGTCEAHDDRWPEAGARAEAAEAKLAGLLEALTPLVEALRGYQPDAASSLYYAREDDHGPEVLNTESVGRLLAAYDAAK